MSNKHGDRSVYLFRCDWYDLETKKMKDDGFFKSVNTSTLWFKNAPFILASQAETCFYLDDTKFGNPWKVVQTFSNRRVYDVPEKEDGNEGAFQGNGDAFQDDIGSTDYTFQDVEEQEDAGDVEADMVASRHEGVRVDARIVHQLAQQHGSSTIDMDISEDEVEAEDDAQDNLDDDDSDLD